MTGVGEWGGVESGIESSVCCVDCSACQQRQAPVRLPLRGEEGRARVSDRFSPCGTRTCRVKFEEMRKRATTSRRRRTYKLKSCFSSLFFFVFVFCLVKFPFPRPFPRPSFLPRPLLSLLRLQKTKQNKKMSRLFCSVVP